MTTSNKKKIFIALFTLVLLSGGCAYLEAHRQPVILTYHTLGTDFAWLAPYIDPQTFEKQMALIKKGGYRVITLDEMVANIKTGENPRKTLAITFDDGYENNLIGAKILAKYGFPATIFAVAARMGTVKGYMTPDQAREMEKTTPVRIASHTMTHPYLPKQSDAVIRREIIDSKLTLEKMLGHPVAYFAYPEGGYTPGIVAIVKEAGYEAAFTTNRGDGKDVYAIKRVKPTLRDNAISFWVKFSGYYYIGKKTKKGH